jgi:small nuclear ribonucleoprotein (snRNP)-like protein
MTPLLYFLTRLRGDTITAELKDGTSVTGTVQRVDNEMNIYLLNAFVVGASATRPQSTSLETHTAPVLKPWDERTAEPDPQVSDFGVQRRESAKEYRVRGSTIRYIILPETLDMESAVRGIRRYARRKRPTQGNGGNAVA